MDSQKIQGFTKYTDQINPVFEKLILQLLKEMPDDYVNFSINWLQNKGQELYEKNCQPKKIPQLSILKELEDEQNLPKQCFSPRGKPAIQDLLHKSDDEEEEQEEGFDEGQLQKSQSMSQKPKKNFRMGVSAEVYGHFNQKKSYFAKVIEKDDDQKARIEKRLMQAFMFSALDEKEREIVINAMEEVRFKTGEWVIKQGEDGDNLYVVDSGELDCFKRFNKNSDEQTYLKTYKPGEAFGELALLYNAPRAASIQAKIDSVLFSLDRECFNNIVKDSTCKKRERMELTLRKVELFENMDPYELTKICDGMKDIKVKAGEFGEVGNNFYIVESGNLKATKTNDNGGEEIVYEYTDGDYFGELALVNNIPRQANVIAIDDCKLVYLDCDSFKRLMGPIEAILQRNQDRYQNYVKKNH